MRAITDLKIFQSEILSSNSKISKEETLQLTKIKNNFINLSNNLKVLQTENSSLQNELFTLKINLVSL